MVQVGERVGVILSAQDKGGVKVVNFIGYGVYTGDEIPPKGMGVMGLDSNEMGRKNPRIDLDNGHTVWGCQCWWGDANEVKTRIEAYEAEGYTIKDVSPEIYEPTGE